MRVTLGNLRRSPKLYSRQASLAASVPPLSRPQETESRPGSQASHASTASLGPAGYQAANIAGASPHLVPTRGGHDGQNSRRSRRSSEGRTQHLPRPDLDDLMRRRDKARQGDRGATKPPDLPLLRPRRSMSGQLTMLGEWVRGQPTFKSSQAKMDSNRPITPLALQRMRARLDSRGFSIAPRHHAHILDAVFYPPTADALQNFAATL